jgi:PAS domain S-box-containing protein
MQEALRRSEARYRMLAAYSGDLTLILDEIGVIRYAAPSVRAELGFQPEDLLDRTLVSLVHPNDGPYTRRQLDKALQTPGRAPRMTFRLADRHGRWRVFEGLADNMRDRPEANGLVIALRDVTEHMAMQEALRRTNNVLEGLGQAHVKFLQGVPAPVVFKELLDDMMALLGCEFGLVAMGPAGPDARMDLLATINLPELAGRSAIAVPAALAATDGAVLQVACDPDGALRLGDPETAERALWCLPLRSGGALVGLLGMARAGDERSEAIADEVAPFLAASANLIVAYQAGEEKRRMELALRESQARYRTVVENIDEVIFQADAQGHWTFLNPAWTAITGHGVEESLGRPAVAFVGTDRPTTLTSEAAMARLAASADGRTRDLVPFRVKQGGHRWLEVVARRALDPHGAFIGVLGTMKDVTESKAAQEDLERAHAELLRLNLVKDEFVSTVSHELRSPLTAIKNAISILARPQAGPLTEVQARYVGVLAEQAGRLNRLVDDLLDLQQLETGSLSVVLDAGDVRGVAQDAARGFAPVLEAKRIQLELAIDPAPLWARFDRDRMAQVVINLLANAAKFTPEGGRVTLRAAAHGGAVMLAVLDSGPGIAPDDVARIFEKFVRLDNGHGGRVEGTGLGLAICKKIVEVGHGGRIWVESTPGAGAAFFVSLPAGEPPALSADVS